jgi:C1A family cysteine protease
MYNLGKKNTRTIPKNIIADQATAAKISRSLRSSLTLPDYVNWVQMGAVTDIKNQGACGACWAFSTTGALEGAKFVKTGELIALSEQNLLDCDHSDMGCNGGLMDDAFKFDEKSGGLCSEADYPYQAVQNDSCNTACTDVPGSIVKTFVDVPPGDERALLSAVAMQPISVAIQADQFPFQFYRRGVLNDESCGEHAQVDHGVLAVGYGTDLDTQIPYWLVKNSWGESVSDMKMYILYLVNAFGVAPLR